MNEFQVQTLHKLEATLDKLMENIPAPQLKRFGDSYAYRFAENTIHQAIVQKLARIISGLYAAQMLLDNGFLQEQGALHRMLDEFQEDAVFLSFAVIDGKITELHKRYLDAFFAEELDIPNDLLKSSQNRAMIPRKKIRAFIANRDDGDDQNPSRAISVGTTLSKAYSGYVHGASPHIMEMFDGQPPRFQVSGVCNTSLVDAHKDDLWNYFYRGVCTFGFAAMAFDNRNAIEEIMSYLRKIDAASS